MRIVLLTAGIFSPFFNVFAGDINPTAPNELLKYYSGDFTDSDGDGMTDVAETHYGYDANDANDFPTYDYFLDDGVIAGIPNDPELGSKTDQIYFRFSKFSDDLKVRTREFLILLMPIMYDMLGNPAESFVCTFYNTDRSGSWMSYNKGRAMACSSAWIPRLLVHELVHAWKGKYVFSSSSTWTYNSDLSGFEETAEGLAYAIIHEFINAYPTHEVSKEMLEKGAWGNWSPKTSTYDMHKHQRFLGAGDFWVDGPSPNVRYSSASTMVQILLNHDKYFMKKVLDKYYTKIQREPDWRPNREDLIDLWADVVPYVNGIDTKEYLNALPILRGKKLAEGVYPIIINNSNARDGGSKKVYVGYADKVRGNLWLRNIRDSNLADHDLPTWLKLYKHTDDYYYADHRNQPFEVHVNTIYGEKVLTYTGTTNNSSRQGGLPNNLGDVSPNELQPNKFPVGLYKETLTFTEYAKHTDEATEDYYFFGFDGFKQDKETEVVLFIGVDSQVATEVSIGFADGVESLPFVNGCAVFRSTDLHMNVAGTININVTALDGRVNVYQRTLINGGSNDDYRQQQFLIIDQDFDGIEDLYDSDVVSLENSSHVTYAEVANGTYDFMTPEGIEPTKGTPTEFTVETTTDGIVIRWKNPDSLNNGLLLYNGSDRLYYGGHPRGYATVNYAKFGLTGKEVLTASFYVYGLDRQFRYKTDEVRFSLSDYNMETPDTTAGPHDHSHFHDQEVVTTDIQIETETAVVVVEDATAVEVTDNDVAIVKTESNVVVVENTTSVSEVSEDESNVEDVVVLITEDSVAVVAEEETTEVNASSSVIVVTETEVVVDDSVDVATLEVPDLPLVKSIWESAEAVASDWYYFDWFGYFFKVEGNDWVYNSTLGWFWVGWTTTSESVWMYHAKLGWIWTSAKQFPYVYNSYDDTWIFINMEHNLYFNYTTREWKPLSSQ